MTGQLELEKIRACFEMCHKILTTDVRGHVFLCRVSFICTEDKQAYALRSLACWHADWWAERDVKLTELLSSGGILSCRAMCV